MMLLYYVLIVMKNVVKVMRKKKIIAEKFKVTLNLLYDEQKSYKNEEDFVKKCKVG